MENVVAQYISIQRLSSLSSAEQEATYFWLGSEHDHFPDSRNCIRRDLMELCEQSTGNKKTMRNRADWYPLGSCEYRGCRYFKAICPVVLRAYNIETC
jgi:hypothetical protein